MKRPALLAIVVAIGIVVFLFVRSRGGDDAPAPQVEPSATAPADKAPERRQRGEMPQELSVLMDDDIEGTLRLEGQVVDVDQNPVAGATVRLDSNPPRTTTSEEDGSFFFDKLVARRYRLVAKADEGTAGPVMARLSESNDPIILIVRPAATVEVKVTAAGDRRAIADADVELRGLMIETAVTDSGGVARIGQVPAGGYQVVARASGYAQSATWLRIGGGEVTETVELQLKRGAPVAGRVIGPDGAAVEGAVVLYSGASDWSQQADPRFDGAVTNAKGEFRVAALPQGTFRFSARHEEFAPGASEPVTLDGRSERTGVVIELEAGALVAGRVVDKGGAPVPGAAVRIAVGGRGMRFESARQTFTAEDGTFEMKALPRRELDVVAVHETASSAIESVDASAAPEQRDVELVLDVDGRIAGIVVDSEGEPVEGAQVMARPDRRAIRGRRGGFDRRAFRLRGRQTELTDAGGRFEFRGLEDAPYQLRANPPGVTGRGRAWLREGVSAQVGDLEVRIELEADGGVKGKVAFADGSVPEAFTVSAGGWGRGTPFSTKDGAFELGDLPPREYQLTINGVGFERKQIDANVESGKTVDVGTITVVKGRVLAGRVITADRRPVAGATVTVGKMLFGSGSSTSTGGRFGPPGSQRNKEVVTDDNGEFSVRGVGTYDLNMVAEHETEGRTAPVTVPGSRESTVDIELVMAPTGALEGIVTSGGAPADAIRISCQSQAVPGAIFGVATGADGKFRFDRLAPGDYMVSAMSGGNPMRGMGFHDGTKVTVVSNETAQVRLELGEGAIELEVTIVPKQGEYGLAQLFAVQAKVTAKTARELSMQTVNREGGYSSFGVAMGGRPGVISDLAPGEYTICVAPYPGEVQGMRASMDYMEQHGDDLPVFCKAVVVQPEPEHQEVQIDVVVPDYVPPSDGA